jgi:parvulin-like peptidyl-prolyl isomerase
MKKRTLLAAGALCATAAGWMPPHVAQAQQTGNAPKAGTASTPAKAPATPAAPAKPVSPTAVAAEVNNEKIMLIDLERMVSSFRERQPALAANTPEAQAALKSVREQILNSLVTQRLLYQEAKRRKIEPKREDVDKAMLEFKNSFEKSEDYQNMLTRVGKTEQDVRQRITEEMAIRELSIQLTADVVVADAEIEKFYNENKDAFTLPEVVKAHHILISFPQKRDARGRVEFVQPSAADKNKLKARANNVLKQAQAKGADFEKLALQYSEDPTAKGNESMPGNKGNLGEFTRERVLKAFGDAVFAAPVGKVFGPVETEYGFHIVRVDSKTPGRVLPISEARADIRMALVQPKAKARLDQAIAEITKRATIKKNI